MRWRVADLDRQAGVIRAVKHAYSQEGGLAVLTGNVAPDGCVVKTGAVPAEMLTWSGTARVFEDQNDALTAIDAGEIAPHTAVVIRYEGPKGGPGMQEMLKPTMSLKAQKVDDTCALITDGRFSGATAGLSIGHISPEAAAQGPIALIEDGDTVQVDIPGRRIDVMVDADTLAARHTALARKHGSDAWIPAETRPRKITKALRVYAAFAASADKGGIRE
jgi:dihydroxy-acid dehydratase